MALTAGTRLAFDGKSMTRYQKRLISAQMGFRTSGG
jgi:hypothetical protein